MFSKIFSFTTLVAAVSAYTVLTPTLNSTVVKGKSTSVTWSSVDTDASTFSIYLVNFKDWPPTVISLAQNVPQSEKSVDVTIPCDVTSDYGWQLNFINGTNTYVIYAQSNSFSLSGSCVNPTTTSSVSVATTTAYATKNSTVTAYSTATTTAISKVIETVTFTSPIVWFVQPTSIGSMCAPEKTVTVYASGPSPTGTGSESSGHGSGSGSGPSGTYGNSTTPATKPSYSVSPSGTGAGVGAGSGPKSTSTTTPVFTGAATSVQAGSLLALVAGAAVFLL
ncbi:hypothetical protein SBOR_3353 [Sclerotinia borealis F-4128]|uniref:Yeast cell wall synthesis Kre9/Knh1-like N-terminal domain-containing protein n=1 Tax=Sclerotinia borealis (strain F-4128) TaxID=1432307 RepID=W9CK07_SCLBF|nr:hypothetical protein SBOR_3353 [Sclerotinia borealis F-4128]